MSETQKKWTVLIYANGNNDLEPEIWKSAKSIQSFHPTEGMNVLVQIGRLDRQLVSIIRPSIYFPSAADEWSGVRRYILDTAGLTLLDAMKPINMSDSKCLYDFMKWGVENYPAEHFMLILGGHAYQLVGMMPDYSQDKPYILGFPEMCLALERAHEALGQKIDLLVLDTCYCNCVEVLYELGKAEDPPVNNMITYVGKGPLGGLPYDTLLQELKKGSSMGDLNSCTRKLVDSLNYDLVAFHIDHVKLETIKSLCDSIARSYLSDTSGIKLTPGELITSMDPGYSWFNPLNKLRSSLQSMILCGNSTFAH